MCLAIPMRVLEIKGMEDELFNAPVALVEMGGLRQEVRLDIVDRRPEPGEFVIVHAGFAIQALSACEAENNLGLMRQMAECLDD